ncbi:MAG: glycosyltransferase, partial [Nitrospinaceae bacterium]
MADRVVIAGGGTGGHLYPGIALAKALMKHDSKLQIVFVGTRQGLESRALPREGFPLKTIVSGGLLGKRGWARFMAWARLPVGFVQSLVFLAGRRPRLVVGVGGYVSGPLVAAAWLLRIPTLIHEQNAHPGITNRLLGRGVDRVALTFEDAARFFPAGKWTVTGNLIRETFARAEPPQPPSGRTSLRVLLLGGSLGAHSINIAMIDALEFLGPLKERLSF